MSWELDSDWLSVCTVSSVRLDLLILARLLALCCPVRGLEGVVDNKSSRLPDLLEGVVEDNKSSRLPDLLEGVVVEDNKFSRLPDLLEGVVEDNKSSRLPHWLPDRLMLGVLGRLPITAWDPTGEDAVRLTGVLSLDVLASLSMGLARAEAGLLVRESCCEGVPGVLVLQTVRALDGRVLLGVLDTACLGASYCLAGSASRPSVSHAPS